MNIKKSLAKKDPGGKDHIFSEFCYLTDEQADYFVERMKKSPYMMSLGKEKIKSAKAIILRSKERAVGFCSFMPLGNGWFEFGPIYIDEEYRSMGLLGRALPFIDKEFKGKKIFATSRNPRVVKKLEENGFTNISIFRLPKEVLWDKIKYIANPETWKQLINRARGAIKLEKEDAGTTKPRYMVKIIEE